MQSCCWPFIKKDVFVFLRMGHVFASARSLQDVFVEQPGCAGNVLRHTDASFAPTLLLHDNTAERHYKGEHMSRSLTAELQKRHSTLGKLL